MTIRSPRTDVMDIVAIYGCIIEKVIKGWQHGRTVYNHRRRLELTCRSQ